MTPRERVELRVDGRDEEFPVEPRMLLCDALRDLAGKKRVHVGCEQGVCGACTVLVDGEPVRSCLVLAVEMRGRDVVTYEGLLGEERMGRVLAAVAAHGGLQCGYCTPGMAVNVWANLARGTLPDTEGAARDLLESHVCRCTGYQALVAAILDLARGNGPARSRPGVQE